MNRTGKFFILTGVLIATFLLFTGIAYAFTFTEEQVTTNASNQTLPAISGDLVVYSDDRNGNEDIFMTNLETGIETPITTAAGDQMYPSVYGDWICWSEDKGGSTGMRIYAYNLPLGPSTLITTTGWYYTVDIDDNILVWADNRAGFSRRHIWVCDLTQALPNETQVTFNESSQDSVQIDGSRVVYMDDRKNPFLGADIYMTDLSQTLPNERQITSGSDHYYVPDISGENIVYFGPPVVNPADDRDIYLYNLSTSTETPITTDGQEKQQVRICGDFVIWCQSVASVRSVFVYEISTGQTQCLNPGGSFDQELPAIDGNRVIWTDHRDVQNQHIWMAELTGTQNPPTPQPELPFTGR